jgi:hypothetical protein
MEKISYKIRSLIILFFAIIIALIFIDQYMDYKLLNFSSVWYYRIAIFGSGYAIYFFFPTIEQVKEENIRRKQKKNDHHDL